MLLSRFPRAKPLSLYIYLPQSEGDGKQAERLLRLLHISLAFFLGAGFLLTSGAIVFCLLFFILFFVFFFGFVFALCHY